MRTLQLSYEYSLTVSSNAWKCLITFDGKIENRIYACIFNMEFLPFSTQDWNIVHWHSFNDAHLNGVNNGHWLLKRVSNLCTQQRTPKTFSQTILIKSYFKQKTLLINLCRISIAMGMCYLYYNLLHSIHSIENVCQEEIVYSTSELQWLCSRTNQCYTTDAYVQRQECDCREHFWQKEV